MPDDDAALKPTWTGHDEQGAQDALRKLLEGKLQREYALSLDELEGSEAYYLRRLREYAEKVRELNRELSDIRAQLREKRASPPQPVAASNLAEEVGFMRRLPGVMGIRVDDRGYVVVHVRTGMLYRRSRYDFGDFEIFLGTKQDYYSEGITPTVEITCTRSGLNYTVLRKGCDEGCCDEEREYAKPLYWHPERNWRCWGGVGPGMFCFGSRANQINELNSQGRYGEMLHLMIASMCDVNSSDMRDMTRSYRRAKLCRRDRKELRARLGSLAVATAFGD